MRKATVVIADDEPLARRALREHLGTLAGIGEIHEAGDGWTAIKTVDSVKPHILFLDIVMPGVSGLEVAEQIAHRPYIVFTTAYEKFAVTAFEIGALDYLLKPFGRDRVAGVVERARAAIEHGLPSVVARAKEILSAERPLSRVFVRERGRMVAVNLDGVERLEACDDYVELHSAGRQYLLHARLQDLESRLPPDRFVRIHRSHLVNLDFVAAIEPHDGSRVVAVFKSGARVTSSRAGAAKLRARTS